VPKLTVTSFAQNDIRNASIWLNSQDERLVEEFAEDIHEALERIGTAPQIYSILFAKVRRCLLRRFRYHLYFVLSTKAIRVIAVVHTSRSPRFIKKTVRKRR